MINKTALAVAVVVLGVTLSGCVGYPWMAGISDLASSDASDIAAILDNFHSLMSDEGDGEPWLRLAHAKQHGCVRGEVSVSPTIPAALKCGVFANVSATYPLFVRYSNGAGNAFSTLLHQNESDAVPDIRGMAVKIFNVPGDNILPNSDSQDFLLTTDTVTFLDTLDRAKSFFKAISKGTASTTLWLAENPRLALLYGEQGVIISNLLSQQFYSPVPNNHCGTIVKHHFSPCASKGEAEDGGILPDFNGLRQALQESLRKGEACFDWKVQAYESESKTPVNDSTVVWPTPYTTIGRLTLYQQAFGSPGQESFCRQMAFNPGHSIEDHAPVGATNELRVAAYQAMANQRHAILSQKNTPATYQDWLNYPDM